MRLVKFALDSGVLVFLLPSNKDHDPKRQWLVESSSRVYYLVVIQISWGGGEEGTLE